MTLAEQAGWLEADGSAWEGLDATPFSSLFTGDLFCWWGPSSEPLRGRGEIEARVAAALARQADVHGYEPRALIDHSRGVSRWWVSYRVQEEDASEETGGVFLVTLDDRGRCTEFRTWWNMRRTPIGE